MSFLPNYITVKDEKTVLRDEVSSFLKRNMSYERIGATSAKATIDKETLFLQFGTLKDYEYEVFLDSMFYDQHDFFAIEPMYDTFRENLPSIEEQNANIMEDIVTIEVNDFQLQLTLNTRMIRETQNA
ncbi:hypothetical protein IMZ31_22385 (plasmid) [Pontibacillus sp. ALD_SL1]|uniref:hypothetical protein n=1 Tax=Pontibacillus sp. ALD_SL1 TaxID=2777185 RepID=UPI001A969A38|nr:hypothetical protein [Pontibacillus sp. ALD_SL1]QST02204.1 hypothetical protein IMZ31_22385 [Pontibacillus sp. ALD_SL1]